METIVGSSRGAGFVLRRSIPSFAVLLGLLGVVGLVAVAVGRVPIGAVVAIAVGFAAIEYLLAPVVIEWLIPAQVVQHDGSRYLTEEPVGELVARRCRDAGVPLVRLGIVDDGTPNAFTFGRMRRDARIWVTRGLIDRLDRDELDAVVAHEVGHIRHHDFAVMAAVSLIPMMLYLLGRALIDLAGDDDDDDSGELAILGAVLLVCWYVGELLVLSVNRAREYAADHWSCASTGHGDALVSALIKVAQGMSIEDEHAPSEADNASAKTTKAERRADRRHRAVQVMGIFEPAAAVAMHDVFEAASDHRSIVGALRWEAVNPWAGWKEIFSTHPLIARRILALEHSGLPGAPTRFTVTRDVPLASPEERRRLRRRFWTEMGIAVAPWVASAAAILLWIAQETFHAGAMTAVAGVAFLAKQHVRYCGSTPATGPIAALLSRVDAGPVRGIPVELTGRVIGRGTPGHVASADLVIDDGSGFLTLRYRQPIPFAHAWFGLTRAKDISGSTVVVRGWLRRDPQPYVELRDLREVGGDRRARSAMFGAKLVAALVAIAGGVASMVVGLVA